MKEGNNCKNFNWEELIGSIKEGQVIPVIGPCLYLIEKAEKKALLLYDYLADRLAAKFKKISIPLNVNHRFLKATFEYMKKYKEYRVMKEFLIGMLKNERLIAGNPLWKLARIRPFKLFINTTYDDFLLNAIKCVRDGPATDISYTLKKKNLTAINNALVNSLRNLEDTVVYNIYGNLKKSIEPSIIEKDILETIVAFQKDMQENPKNNLFQELQSNSLLFIGCGYDDWLFRFFVRTITNEPFEYQKSGNTYKFIGDNFKKIKKDPRNELPEFLRSHQSEVYYARGGKQFVDQLFKKLEGERDADNREIIIDVAEFPKTAFISFHGADRESAERLATNLSKDGIAVWIDKREFKLSDEIDKVIINAIEKCPVFIPLISKHSKILLSNDGKEHYHYQEWNWVSLINKRPGNKSKKIIPIKIDDTPWMYDKFESIFFGEVKDGKRVGGYYQLKNILLEVQKKRCDP